MSARFQIVEVNPNDAVGGGGCLCNEGADVDCKGPYAVFFATEMANNLSPHVVISLSCAKAVVEAAEGGDILAGGERDPEPKDDVAEVVDAELVDEDDVPNV